MEPERESRIAWLFQSALALEPELRAGYLDDACGADKDLHREVVSLLAAHDEVGSFLSSPALDEVAHQFAGRQIRPPVRSMIGCEIAHYHILSLIGSGGMGDVYLARDERLRREVALKFLPATSATDQERLQRFEQEAFAASRLNHPNIITIFEIVHTNDEHFIAEEYVDGDTLREMLTDPTTKEPRKLDVEKAIDIGLQVASALKAAHTAWIIHRDIKPENVMVRADGLVKVLDFGIAKLAAEERESRRAGDVVGNILPLSQVLAPPLSTVPGTIMGTASYMSPEQARGEQLDGRTDLFSLGAAMFEMVTAERLFSDVASTEALFALQNGNEPLPTGPGGDHLPKELQRIIRRALRRDRHERYASAGELLDDLSRLQRWRQNRTARRIVGLSGLAVVVAIVLAAAAAFLSVSEVWEERVLRDGHTAAARRAVFSPDGRLLVSVGEDKQVIVWDFVRRVRLKTLTDHSAIANAVAFSPNGKWFVTGGEDQQAIVWDASRLDKVAVLRAHRAPVRSVTFSPDGSWLVTGSPEPAGAAIFWDTRNWTKARELPFGSDQGDYLFLAKGRLLADKDGQMWDLTTGRKVKDGDSDWGGNWAAISPDDTQWANVDAAGTVKLMDLRRQTLLRRERGHHDHGRAMTYSPDGQMAASGADHIVLWNAVTLKREATLEHTSIVWSLAFSPDGRWLVSSHGNGSILVWDVVERSRSANLNEHSGPVRSVTFASDGNHIASASEDHSIVIWNVETARKEALHLEHKTRINGVAFSHDGKWLASSDQDGTTILWDAVRQQIEWKVTDDIAPGYCVALSTDGRWVAATGGVYERATGRQVVDFYQPQDRTWEYGTLYGTAFSADSRRLASVTDSGWVMVWDATTWQLLTRHKVSGMAQISISFAPNGQTLVTGDDEGEVRLWRVEPLEQLAVLGRHTARIKSVAFSRAGHEVISSGDDQSICLWDVGSRKLIRRIGTHTSPVLAVAFSPDGKQVAAGEHDGSVRLYTRHREFWSWRWD